MSTLWVKGCTTTRALGHQSCDVLHIQVRLGRYTVRSLVEASVFPLPQVLATEGGEVEQLQLAKVVGGSGPAPIISSPAVDLEELIG